MITGPAFVTFRIRAFYLKGAVFDFFKLFCKDINRKWYIVVKQNQIYLHSSEIYCKILKSIHDMYRLKMVTATKSLHSDRDFSAEKQNTVSKVKISLHTNFSLLGTCITGINDTITFVSSSIYIFIVFINIHNRT